MPRTFRVHLETTASATVRVTLDDDDLVKTAEDIGVDVADLTVDDLRDRVEEAAFEGELPRLCAQCSGWGRSWSLDLGEFEPIEDVVRSDGEVAFHAVEEVTE